MDGRLCTAYGDAIFSSGRNHRIFDKFHKTEVKKLRAWMALEDTAFTKTVGGLDGQRARQIFESSFMTTQAFKTIMRIMTDWFDRLVLVVNFMTTANQSVNAKELADLTTKDGPPW